MATGIIHTNLFVVMITQQPFNPGCSSFTETCIPITSQPN